jgi:Fe-S-cluster containining protein
LDLEKNNKIGENRGVFMQKTPFYADGLRFSCQRCSACCRFEPGYVFLSHVDCKLLAESLKMEYTAFVETFCRWIPAPGGEQLSLKEKSNFDCVFWDGNCGVYEKRPLQCRTYPFWDSVVFSPQMWNGLDCPGINSGKLFSREHIDACLEQRKAEPVLTRGGA